jgi:hypothetical protein
MSSEQVVVSSGSLSFTDYHNRDLVENYYTIKLPQVGQMHKAGEPGKYSFSGRFLDGGRTASISMQEMISVHRV